MATQSDNLTAISDDDQVLGQPTHWTNHEGRQQRAYGKPKERWLMALKRYLKGEDSASEYQRLRQ